MLGRSRRFVFVTIAALTVMAGLVAGRASAKPKAQITVYAAASLTDVFPKIGPAEKYQFGGSNTLAAQITQGAPADVLEAPNKNQKKQKKQQGV